MISGFNGPFDPSNWTSLPGNGMTITKNTTSITMASTNALSNQDSYVQTTLTGNYIVTFDWIFNTTSTDERFWDPFGYYTNSTLVYLTNRTDNIITTTPLSGSVSLYLTSGTLFRFFKWTNENGVGSTAIITNFKYRLESSLTFTNDFTGLFQPSNWIIANTPVVTSIINSTTITMIAPSTFFPENSDGVVSITPSANTVITFDWSFAGIDNPTNDYFVLYINNDPIWICDVNSVISPRPISPLSGSVGIYVPAGKTLKFLKHNGSLSSSTSTVNNFKFVSLSDPIPGGFTGPFDPSNWTSLPGNGMTITKNASSITMASTSAFFDQNSYVQTTLTGNYIVTFDWIFRTINPNERFFDPFGYYTNSTLVYLSNRTDNAITITPLSGSVKLYLTSGTLFRFYKFTNENGIGSTATITNFTYTLVPTLSFTNNFTGLFQPSDWQIFNTSSVTSSINSTTITMNSPGSASGDGTISITPTIDAVVTFDWNFVNSNNPTFMYFILYINNDPIWICDVGSVVAPRPISPLSGSVGVYVPAGKTLKFLKRGSAGFSSTSNVTNFKFAPLQQQPIPCFALSNLIKYKLPSDANIVYKNRSNGYWIDVNNLYLTKDHIVKTDGKLLTAENVSNDIVEEEDDVVDIQTSDGRFITINGVEVATSK